MGIKQFIAKTLGKTAYTGLRLMKRNGASYPGQLALKVDPTILADLAKDYETVIITGTNGKTLTTALTTQALKQAYPHVLTNSTGSNMIQGIVSAFLSHKVPAGQKKVAVLEVDEAYLVQVAPYLKPKVIVTTNIFRDQMDRFGEIYTTYQKILDGIATTPDTIVLANGDAPIFNSKDMTNKQVFFGFNHEADGDLAAHYNVDGILCPRCEKILRYRFITYANQGKYYCPHCDFKRPELDFAINAITEQTLSHSAFQIDGVDFKIPVAGLYNMYNALAAYSVARLFDIPAQVIQKGFSETERVFGRQEVIAVADKKLLINLIKNPVGLNQVLDLLDLQKEASSLVILLNDNYADGQDVSWIWDGQFEQLVDMPIQKLMVGGRRKEEMALRLEVAGFKKEDMILESDLGKLIEGIKTAPTQHVNILATYTAMLAIRKELANQGYVKGQLD